MNSISPRAILKWSRNTLAIICHSCGHVAKFQKDFSKKEEEYVKGIGPLGPQYCIKCKSNDSKTESARDNQIVHTNRS